ncbi:MAG TPA: septum site-determining protein MinC [Pusillimonas sp.]|uniref:septum site-determining protein MinC n=1 Tax=Pusillimonas sp. TaxID=3040095 RepID=UPI002B56C50E|nr:septum site-determining protein MinC [Pusillimonas sp.]HUH88094.1 septum site-determining protein MinC [Pusillimonas sp.]
MSKPASQHKGAAALDFKSAALYALRVVIRSADMSELQSALDQRMSDAGSFFENEPVVLDATAIDAELDWPALLQALRDHRLHPIGVVAQGSVLEAARACGLPEVDLSSPPARPASTPAPEAEVPVVAPAAAASPQTPPTAPQAPAAPAIAPAAMVVNRQLRSGQRIYARDTDLIVIGVVGQGAEVIADGNIHVYGPLRGKAMAGARGDASARIFTTQLDPELVAIAGVYRVIETKLESDVHNQAAIVQLDGETLQIKSLGTKA